MEFTQKLAVDAVRLEATLGYGGAQPDVQTALALQSAVKAVESAARPRWVSVTYELEWPPRLKQPGLRLLGFDIAAHLENCTACVVLAVTLGHDVDGLIRAAQTDNIGTAVLCDAACSVLVDQYADLAEGLLRQKAEEAGLFITMRYSPGYGDLPLQTNTRLAALVGAQKAIGVVASATGALLPSKSLFALLGRSAQAVTGRMAGCTHCALREECTYRKKGGFCAKQPV